MPGESRDGPFRSQAPSCALPEQMGQGVLWGLLSKAPSHPHDVITSLRPCLPGGRISTYDWVGGAPHYQPWVTSTEFCVTEKPVWSQAPHCGLPNTVTSHSLKDDNEPPTQVCRARTAEITFVGNMSDK